MGRGVLGYARVPFREFPSMSVRSKYLRLFGAVAVHILTATGGVLGLFSLLSACDGLWANAFAWLGAALIVDGVDGPLARIVDVKRVLPRFSGEELDHLVDYITYVAAPAFMVARADIVPMSLRLPLAAIIMLVSLYHFSDTESKTADGYFVGFPAIWNVVVLYCFVLDLPPDVSAWIIAICAVFTFIPLYWVHPMRVRRLRPLTFAVVSAWGAAAVSAILRGFPGTPAAKVIFAIAAIYIIGIGLSARTGGVRRFHPVK
jgi:phosphatidylcholine synthase